MIRERLIELLLDNGFRFMQESERSERYIWKDGHDFIIITIHRGKNGVYVESFVSGYTPMRAWLEDIMQDGNTVYMLNGIQKREICGYRCMDRGRTMKHCNWCLNYRRKQND